MKILYRVGAVLFLAIMVLGMAMLFTPFIFDTVWLRLLGLIPMVIGFIGGVFCLGQTEDELKSKREKLYKKLEDDDVFSVVEGTLFLRKQCSELKKFISLKRYVTVHTSYTPESYTYTSVSGNGMTFGTLRKNSESYGMNARSTNRGEFLFYNLQKNEYCEITSIILTDEAKKADRTAIASFVEYDTIYLVRAGISSTTSGYVNSVSMKGESAANAMNLFANDMTNSRRKLSDLRKIKKWICGKI